MGRIEVKEIDRGELAEGCRTFVSSRARAVTDLLIWRSVVTGAYDLESHFLGAVEDREIVGFLGLYLADHPIFGKYLTTAPFGSDGGFFFQDQQTKALLAKEARTLADRLDVDYLLIRGRGLSLDGFSVDRHYSTAVIDLKAGAEGIWRDQLKAKTRNQVRRGMKEGFRICSGPDQMEPFYEVFHRHMKDLGSPAHALRFYQEILEHLGERVEFLVARDGEDLAAGALLFWVNDTAMNLHTVSLRKYNRRCPNYLVYWKMLEKSCARGCLWFDMGRSEANSSVMRFKENWSPQVTELHYNYYLRKLREIPYLDPRNPKFRLPIAVWRRLPLFLTKALGPWLIAGIL